MLKICLTRKVEVVHHQTNTHSSPTTPPEGQDLSKKVGLRSSVKKLKDSQMSLLKLHAKQHHSSISGIMLPRLPVFRIKNYKCRWDWCMEFRMPWKSQRVLQQNLRLIQYPLKMNSNYQEVQKLKKAQVWVKLADKVIYQHKAHKTKLILKETVNYHRLMRLVMMITWIQDRLMFQPSIYKKTTSLWSLLLNKRPRQNCLKFSIVIFS